MSDSSGPASSGVSPLRAVIERSLTGKLTIALTWGAWWNGTTDEGAKDLQTRYGALATRRDAIKGKIASAPAGLVIPSSLISDFETVGEQMERLEARQVGYTAKDRTDVGEDIDDLAATALRLEQTLDAMIDGWIKADKDEQAKLSGEAAELVKSMRAFSAPRDADEHEIEALDFVRAQVRSAVTKPRLTREDLDAGYNGLLEFQKTVKQTGRPARDAAAADVRKSLAALHDPRLASPAQVSELKQLRDAVETALAADPLTSLDVEEGYAAVGVLQAAITRVRSDIERADAAHDALTAPLHDRLNEHLAAAAEVARDAKARADAALAAWRKALEADGQRPDDDLERAVNAALLSVTTDATDWRKDILGDRETVIETPETITIEQIDDKADVAREKIAAHGKTLDEQLAALTKIASDTTSAAAARLVGADETKLSNAFGKDPGMAVNERNVRKLLSQLGDRIENQDVKFANIMAFLQGLADQGVGAVPEKASRQKPTEVIRNYITKVDATLLPTYTSALQDSANALEPKGLDKVVELARQLVAIGSGDRETDRWLVKLFVNGASVAGLIKFYQARATLQATPLDTDMVKWIDSRLADPGFDAAVFARIDARKKSAALFTAGLKALVLTGREEVAGRVAEDYYGLMGPGRPDNGVEGRIASGIADAVLHLNGERTTKDGNGHKFKFHYIGGAPRSLFELHVHKGADNWFPAWKTVANPYERIDRTYRESYRISGQLKRYL